MRITKYVYGCHILFSCLPFVQMDARNLAIMFGPSLVRPLDDNMVAMVRDMSDQCRIVESIIMHVSKQFTKCHYEVS